MRTAKNISISLVFFLGPLLGFRTAMRVAAGTYQFRPALPFICVFMFMVTACTSESPKRRDLNYDLIVAAENGEATKVRELLSRGADVNCQEPLNEQSPLIGASLKGSVESIDLLLAAGAIADGRGANGLTALLVASSAGHVEAIKRLMNAGANAELSDDDGMTPLMLAAQNGEISTVQVLLDNGVQTNALDPKGWSALTYAKSKQHVDVAAILASKGAL